jgi:hypothetical protein
MFIVKDLKAMARPVSPARTLECHGLLDCVQNIDAPEAQLARHMKALALTLMPAEPIVAFTLTRFSLIYISPQ